MTTNTDPLKMAIEALELCLKQLYHDGVLTELKHPKRVAATAAETAISAITAATAQANDAQAIRDAALEEAAKLCNEMGEHYAAYKDTALLNGDVALSNAASGEPRAAEFLANAIRKLKAKRCTCAEIEGYNGCYQCYSGPVVEAGKQAEKPQWNCPVCQDTKIIESTCGGKFECYNCRDDNECQSCINGKCYTGEACVTLGRDNPAPSFTKGESK